MDVISTFRRRLLVAFGIGVVLAMLEIGGFLRESVPIWTKASFSAMVMVIGVGGAFAGATFGRTRRRFVTALALVVVSEVTAATVLLNAACYLGGCGD